MTYAGDQCPGREAGLSHTLDESIRRDGRCIHCTMLVSLTPPPGVPAGASQASPKATISDHDFEGNNLTARCAKQGCGGFKHDHAGFLIGTAPGECQVDHSRLIPWSACGSCDVQFVEPKLAEGKPVGPNHGRGRFPFINRHYDELARLRDMWLGGYIKS